MEYTYKREDERSNFEKWFTFVHGEKPKGDPEYLMNKIFHLEQRLRNINDWNIMHAAALAAWHEKHSRTTTGVSFP